MLARKILELFGYRSLVVQFEYPETDDPKELQRALEEVFDVRDVYPAHYYSDPPQVYAFVVELSAPIAPQDLEQYRNVLSNFAEEVNFILE